jgi:hypothetical protein
VVQAVAEPPHLTHCLHRHGRKKDLRLRYDADRSFLAVEQREGMAGPEGRRGGCRVVDAVAVGGREEEGDLLFFEIEMEKGNR